MKPIENIFGFDCVTCEHNRHCYGGNMGNQFRYCEKSAKKIQNLDNLEKQCKKQKEVIDKAKEYIRIYRSYQKIDNKDYLKGRDEIGCLDIYQVDELLDILKEAK